MKGMAEFINKLEGYTDLEVSIIRATKINKVLKAILKLASIPREEEFHFKSRSQTLLDKWNKLLATETSTPTTASAPAPTSNGTKEDLKSEDEKAAEPTNGTHEPTSEFKDEVKPEVEGAAKTEEVVEKAPEADPKVDVAKVAGDPVSDAPKVCSPAIDLPIHHANILSQEAVAETEATA